MAVNVTDIVGPENMTIDTKERVILILRALPSPAATKRFLYARWARLVGFNPIAADIDRVAPYGQ